MQKLSRYALILGMTFALRALPTFAASREDFSDLKKDVEMLRAQLAKKNVTPESGPIGRVDEMCDNKYGPNAKVTTKQGQLTIGGLVQVWWYSIENDNLGVNAYFSDNFGAGNSNEVFDNDSYRIRRAELKFSLDITKDITAVIMVDPTGGDEANSFPAIPSNQGVVGRGIVAGGPGITLDDLGAFFSSARGKEDFGRVSKRFMQNGEMKPNRVLQDAYINYHSDLIPHHDFTIGQFKPPMGEEGNRNSGQLDFVERSMIGQFSNQRDLGVMVHGSWWHDRFQYWIGGFDTAGSFQNSFASYQSRSDDNDAKDLAWKILLRPLWQDETWGSLEMGYSRQDGVHGESGHGFSFTGGASPSVDGLSLEQTDANRQYAWAWYRPGGPVRGWWMRGEWATMHDRPLPGLGAIVFAQFRPHPFERNGWFFSTGYKLSDSIWAGDLKDGGFIKKMLHDVEFAYRYEVFGNVLTDDLSSSGGNRADVFKTQVHTAGLNYYWKGYNVRTQVNYMWVLEPDANVGNVPLNPPFGGINRRFRDVENNVFMVSHQVMW